MGNTLLYAATVVIWGSSWLAITYQLGVVDPEVSVAYRFVAAAAIMVAYCRLSGRDMRFAPRDHLFFVAMGACLFCTNYILVYLGTQYMTSGLVAVAFSTLSFMNIVNAALLFRAGVNGRVVAGAAAGLVGIATVFWPELRGFDLGGGGGLGLVLTLAGAYSASLGMMVSTRNQNKGLPVIQANAWGMTYGGVLTTLYAAITGHAFIFDPSFSYISSLAFLSLFSTVLAFACYLTLLGRIGPDRAAYAFVLFPILALGLSTLFEGYSWTPLAGLGVALVLWGNLLVLTRAGAITALLRRATGGTA